MNISNESNLERAVNNMDLGKVSLRGLDIAFVPSSIIRYARRNMPENPSRLTKGVVYTTATGAEIMRLYWLYLVPLNLAETLYKTLMQ